MSHRLGILGGGQLAKMIAASATRLGIPTRTWDPSPTAPASLNSEFIADDYLDPAAAARFCDGLSAATYEFENIPPQCAERVASHIELLPNPTALRVSADRADEKNHLRSIGIPVAPFAIVNTAHDLAQAAEAVALPAILKSRSGGYDGKGQAPVETADDLSGAWRSLDQVPAVLEQRIDFERELSVIAVRDRAANTRTWPLCENTHHSSILRTTVAPAAASPDLARTAAEYATKLADSLDYVGVLTLELFDTGTELIANEFAPRVHNSGHWTIEAARTSQFENHVRAVLDLPLGSTELINEATYAAMINIIGCMPPLEHLLAIDGASVHNYAKKPRPSRKLGHVTLVASSASELSDRIDRAQEVLHTPSEQAS